MKSTKKIIVNHVMSSDVRSSIFDNIISYITEYTKGKLDIRVSNKPLQTADLYHYHRINIEENIKDKSICTIHHDLNDTDKWFSIENFLPKYTRCKKLISLNSNNASRLINLGINPNNISIIPHGYNHKILRQKKISNSPDKEKITIGVISKYYERRVKGEAYLYEMAKMLPNKSFEFILVGSGRSTTAAELVNLGFEVRCYDYLPYQLMQSVYEELDILLMCSYYEGGPASVPESLATGTPVFSNNIGMSTDLIKDGFNGYLLSMKPHNDVILFNQILNKGGLLNQLESGARESKNELITWEEVAHEHLSLYENCLK